MSRTQQQRIKFVSQQFNNILYTCRIKIICKSFYYIMNYTAYNLQPYQSLTRLNTQQITKMIGQNKKLLFFHELVVDVTNFNHPGNNNLLQNFQNDPNINFVQPFQNFKHSQNAYILICLRTIGVMENDFQVHSQNETKLNAKKGKHVYKQIRQNQKVKLHQRAIKKIDFSQPILKQLQKLSDDQKQIMVQIPKLIDNPEKMLFKQTPLQEYFFRNSFWVSNFTFQLIFIGLIWHIFSSFQIVKILKNSPFFIFGVIKWTLIQYYFHRFLLHHKIQNKQIQIHLLHHAFPNFKSILALTVHKVVCYLLAFYSIYFFFLSHLQIVILLSGLVISLTFYDIVHYWCHFGYQTNIGWINYLRRNHLKHHYRDQNKGFGVTSTIWDKVFGTLHTQK